MQHDVSEISTAATYVGIVLVGMVLTATLPYVYFVDQCHPYILLMSTKSFFYYFIN